MCEWGTYKTVKLCKPKEFSKRTEIPVDACIADIIQALNNAGIGTEASCCGHNRGLGTIMLSDDRELLIASDFNTARKIEKWFYKKRIKEQKDSIKKF